MPPLLHALFPIMAAEPPAGQLDPEDQDSDDDDLEIGLMGETPKHFAVQVIYWPYHCDQIPQRNPSKGGSCFHGLGDLHLLWWERNSQTEWFRPWQPGNKPEPFTLWTGSREGVYKEETGQDSSQKDVARTKLCLLPVAPPSDWH